MQRSDSSPPPLSSQHESSAIKDLHTSSTKFDFIFPIGKVPGKLQSQSREVTRHKDLAPNFFKCSQNELVYKRDPTFTAFLLLDAN